MTTIVYTDGREQNSKNLCVQKDFGDLAPDMTYPNAWEHAQYANSNVYGHFFDCVRILCTLLYVF